MELPSAGVAVLASRAYRLIGFQIGAGNAGALPAARTEFFCPNRGAVAPSGGCIKLLLTFGGTHACRTIESCGGDEV